MNDLPSIEFGDRNRFWVAAVVSLLALSVVGPLIFGLPVVATAGGADSNFNLQLVQGYMRSLQAGHFFPRWLPDGNAGFGSPVFYFYGRLPFFLAAGLALLLHLSAATGLLFGLGVVRLTAFFTCRAWLRSHSGPAAADCGALVFLAVPVVMMLNTVGRIGFAEATATALIPLLFLCLDPKTMSRHAAARPIAWLGLIYAALASTHLPQTLLAFAVASLYALLLHGFRSLLINAAGAGCGLLLAGSSVVPAVLMQRWISSSGWIGDLYVDIRNNFLFTASRLHQWHLIAQELYLYSSWLLCAGILFAFLYGSRLNLRVEWQVPRSRALFLVLCVCLLAMTKLFWPLWVGVTLLHTLQFPWRLFPASIALAGGLIAILVRTAHRQILCFSLVAVLILAQVAIAALGAFAGLSHSSLAHRVPEKILYRVPSYVPSQRRENPAYSSVRSFPPEYIPATAGAAGWRISPDQRRVVPGAGGTAAPSTLPMSLQQSQTPEGDIVLRGQLSVPASVLLASFFFPDEELVGVPSKTLSLDAVTGLTRVALPAGLISVRLDHRAITPAVLLGNIASAFGALLILLLFSLRFMVSLLAGLKEKT